MFDRFGWMAGSIADCLDGIPKVGYRPHSSIPATSNFGHIPLFKVKPNDCFSR